MNLFSSRSGGEEGGRKLLPGLELKSFAADSNFSEKKKKKNGIFVATGPGPCQIVMTSTVKYMAGKSSVLFISLNKSLDSTCFKRSQISVLYFSYKVSSFQRSPVVRHWRVQHKGHSSPMAGKLLYSTISS